MGSMSRRKGAAGEREAAEKLNEVLGTHLHRGRQYHGGPESPDLAGDVPGLHVEVKRCERLRLYEALGQARRDACISQVPAVMHRANKRPWVIVVEVGDLIRLLDVVDECRAKIGERSDCEAVGQSDVAAAAAGGDLGAGATVRAGAEATPAGGDGRAAAVCGAVEGASGGGDGGVEGDGGRV